MLANPYRLSYAIKKRVPPTQKTMDRILSLQSQVNSRLELSQERLALAPVTSPVRPPFTFPFVRMPDPRTGASLNPSNDAEILGQNAACGSTRAPTLWHAHLIASFLKRMSSEYPDLVFELRDSLCRFVVPGVVTIRGGSVEMEREWLNRERERALELSGDPQAAAPFIWAETQALQGNLLESAPAVEVADALVMAEFVERGEDLEGMTVEDAADAVIARILATTRATA